MVRFDGVVLYTVHGTHGTGLCAIRVIHQWFLFLSSPLTSNSMVADQPSLSSITQQLKQLFTCFKLQIVTLDSFGPFCRLGFVRTVSFIDFIDPNRVIFVFGAASRGGESVRSFR